MIEIKFLSVRRLAALFVVAAGFHILAGCATTPFVAAPVEQAPFIERAIVDTQETVRVAAAVPDAKETRELIGVDLYAKGIQPVWLQVANLGEANVYAALHSIDDDYFSPLEVAWKFRGWFSKQGRADMERWFYENQMPRRIPPGETRSGFVYTHVAKGSKAFNFDAYSSGRSFNFTFVVPMPGFVADYMEVDFEALYDEDEIRVVDLDGLHEALTSYACCSTNESGEAGDPINVVIVATRRALGLALLRAEWQETAANDPDTAVARTHRHLGRRPDGTFHKARSDGSERKELRLWLAPLLVGDQYVWIGQVSYELRRATAKQGFKNYRIDPEIDNARLYLLQNFWYTQSLAVMGFVGGIPPAKIDAPSRNFAGARYFTDGLRVVLFLSDTPVAMDETNLLPWERVVVE
ncbi:MAG: LssY C-terminal domain-containing protein [Betaproteobacteria bacterium]|nr:MAG: LssY C-terminal domain-containing protein [Betaproteobacteria bacterium]